VLTFFRKIAGVALKFLVIERDPVRGHPLVGVLRVELPSSDLFAYLILKPVLFMITEVFAVWFVDCRLIPEVFDVIRTSGTERPKVIDLSRLDVPFVLGNVVLVIHGNVDGSRNVPVVLRIRAAWLVVGAVIGPISGKVVNI
jgi:hypothetical protein